jgi:thiamine-monophosphate kinase
MNWWQSPAMTCKRQEKMANQPEETSLIQKYLAPLAGAAGLGLADDAACLTPNPGMDLVITTDTIVEGVHFLKSDAPRDIAIKAVTVNLSDLVAKGAVPVGYQLALSFPEKPTGKWMRAFAEGLATQLKGQLTGGDITVGRGPLTITITAIGEAPAGAMVRRSGGRAGDLLFVSGFIGTSAAGLLAATGRLSAAVLSTQETDKLTARYTAPVVNNAKETAILVRETASASLDISDGLAIDLERLCSASNVGAEIMVEDIPLDPLVRKLIGAGGFSIISAVTGGDDYVVLLAVPQNAANPLRKAGFFEIGKLVSKDRGVVFVKPDGKALSLEGRSGYDHFTNR